VALFQLSSVLPRRRARSHRLLRSAIAAMRRARPRLSLPPSDVSLARWERVVAPARTAVPVSVGVPPPVRNGRSERHRSSLHTAGFRLTRASAPTCRYPRCLRREWQSEASNVTQYEVRVPWPVHGWLAHDGTSAGRAGPPAIRTWDEPGGHGRRRGQAGISQCYGRSEASARPCGRSSWRPGGLWSSGGVGTVRISFVLTSWSSRPLWASHSRFGALSLTF
jgi:hypothetical protein